MAEVQDLNKILGYVQEREQTLSKYSDKLRKSLVKIANVFGSPEFCQRCNKWAEYHEKPGVKDACDKFKPKIQVSVDVVDDQPFLKEAENETAPEIRYYLAVIDHYLGYVDEEGTYSNSRLITTFEHAPREVLKALVKSGRLIPFLQKVAGTLQDKTEEYRDVAEVAEKMAQAVQ